MESKNLEYTGFWIRFFAVVIDGVLYHFIFYKVFFPIQWFHFIGSSDFSFSDIQQSWLVLNIYGVDDFLFYYLKFFGNTLLPFFITLVFWFAFSATPGKMLFRIKIVDSTTGEKPHKIQLLIRYLCYFLSSIFLLGFVWVFFDSKKQGWHDKIAGTVVVKPKKEQVNFKS